MPDWDTCTGQRPNVSANIQCVAKQWLTDGQHGYGMTTNEYAMLFTKLGRFRITIQSWKLIPFFCIWPA